MASDRGYVDIVRILLEHKANVNLQDEDGYSALHYACICQHTEIAKLLITHGANMDLPDSEGATPRSICIELGMIL